MTSLRSGAQDADARFAQDRLLDEHGQPRILYHGTRRRFAVFDTAAIEHFGFHVGTLAQARKFGSKPMALYVAIANPIRLPDLGTWGFENLARHLDRRGLGILSALDYERAWGARDQSGELRTILLEKGYDGIVYANAVEGRGDSFIAFEPAQLRSVADSERACQGEGACSSLAPVEPPPAG